MEFKTEWLVKGLIESVFVIGSILIALGVDEWAESRDFAEIADLSLGIFEQEIAQNRARVEDGLPYHVGIRDVLAQMAQNPEAVVELRSILEGVEAPVLLNTAWETALATGALTHMDFEVVRAISLTYSIQEGFASRSRLDRTRFGSMQALSGPDVQERLREAHDYVAALTRDEAELLTVFSQAQELISASRRGGSGPGADSGDVEAAR